MLECLNTNDLLLTLVEVSNLTEISLVSVVTNAHFLLSEYTLLSNLNLILFQVCAY